MIIDFCLPYFFPFSLSVSPFSSPTSSSLTNYQSLARLPISFADHCRSIRHCLSAALIFTELRGLYFRPRCGMRQRLAVKIMIVLTLTVQNAAAVKERKKKEPLSTDADTQKLFFSTPLQMH